MEPLEQFVTLSICALLEEPSPRAEPPLCHQGMTLPHALPPLWLCIYYLHTGLQLQLSCCKNHSVLCSVRDKRGRRAASSVRREGREGTHSLSSLTLVGNLNLAPWAEGKHLQPMEHLVFAGHLD